MKIFIPKRPTPKTAIAELLVKFLTKRKSQKKQFHHCETNIFLEKVTKSINYQTNINSSANDSLTAKFYQHLSNKLSFNAYQ